MNNADTIYALASANGRAGVAIIRVSGPLTSTCVIELTGALPKPRFARLCKFVQPGSDDMIDEGLVLWFAGPASYTGEDMAELQVHGSRAVVSSITKALAGLGCRLAEPGEFTRRAVVHGKLDLTAAEGVVDLVDAETEAQRKQALRQLGGALATLTQNWRTELTRLEAHLVAAIDFADDDLPAGLIENIRQGVSALVADLRLHLESGIVAERLREGVYAAIIGAPNVGKSSLLNRLTRRDVAIVTALAGTTRDVLEVPMDVGGYPLTLADTAGLREAVDVVEQEGIRRALERANMADFKLLVLDATAPDLAVLSHYKAGDIIALNKCELAVPDLQLPVAPIRISARTGDGLNELMQALAARTAELAGVSANPTLTRSRHREVVAATIYSLERALQPTLNIDQLADDIRHASRTLGRLTGQVGIEDLLDVVFRDFCLGK